MSTRSYASATILHSPADHFAAAPRSCAGDALRRDRVRHRVAAADALLCDGGSAVAVHVLRVDQFRSETLLHRAEIVRARQLVRDRLDAAAVERLGRPPRSVEGVMAKDRLLAWLLRSHALRVAGHDTDAGVARFGETKSRDGYGSR
jgi:hypothetical protein